MLAVKTRSDLEHFTALDTRLVNASKQIKVLTNLSWPQRLCDEFLEQYRQGNPRLPDVEYKKVDYTDQSAELAAIMAACDRAHPIGDYLYKTANSYKVAARMLHYRTKPEFTEASIELYGRPSDPIGGRGLTHLDAAAHFIDSTREYIVAYHTPENELCVSAEQVAKSLKETLVPFFKSHPVEVVIDSALTSKAAAAARRIRLRAGTCFSSMDVGQLVQHEGLVHMLTMLNGREQPYLKSMGLGSPRTTRTQEGLATFAELITSTIDLNRLQRIALRIRGVQMALDGADFLELFQFFREAGQAEQESFYSAARIFRGGDPRGGVAFTKDIVYLEGLIFIHTFLRKTIQENKFRFPAYLFAGRLALSDVVGLEPFFESGFIASPLYEPPWLQNRNCLAAYLCYAVFANRISLGDVKLDDFRHRD